MNEENQPLVTHGPVEVQDSMKITDQFREIHREPENPKDHTRHQLDSPYYNYSLIFLY